MEALEQGNGTWCNIFCIITAKFFAPLWVFAFFFVKFPLSRAIS